MKTSTLLITVAVSFAASPVLAQSWSAEVYGGGVFERSEDYNNLSFDLDSGTAFGAGIYNGGWVSGVELGIDIMSTRADYTGFTSGVNTLSFMAVARMAFPLGATTEGYVGGGLGAINVEYDGGTSFPAFTGDDTVAGGQISFGVRYPVGTGQIFGELKHQAAFDDAEIVVASGTDVQSYSSTSLLAGFSFRF